MKLLLQPEDLARYRGEAGLTSIVLQAPERLAEVLDAVDVLHFRCEPLRRVVEEVSRLARRGDVPGLEGLALHLDAVGVPVSSSCLAKLYESVGAYQSIGPFVERVRRDLAEERVRASMDALGAAVEDGADIEPHVRSLQEAGALSVGAGAVPMLSAVSAELDVISEEMAGRGAKVWSTGLEALDGLLAGRGLRGGQLVLIGGRPGMGKTALGLQVADAIASTGGRVHVYSGEMTRGQLVRRLLSLWTETDASDLQRPRHLAQSVMQRIVDDVAGMGAYPMLVDDRGGKSWGEMVAEVMRSAFRLGGLDLVLVDYLQLLRVPPGETEYTAYTAASKAAKALAKELECVVILLCQLNRASATRSDREPQMTDLRATGQLEQDADTVLFPYRPAEDAPEAHHHSEARLLVRKQRAGRTGAAPVRWTGHLTRFDDLDAATWRDE